MNQTPMPRYIGTKTLFAMPMTRGEYNAYRGWTPPVGEDQEVAGYLVEYEDGGQPNDSRHAGYISWSPKDVFERTYKPTDAAGPAELAPKPAPGLEFDSRGVLVPTAPRVTPADIDAAIASEHYFTAKEGVLGMLAADGVAPTTYEQANAAPAALGLLTICVLVLRNGFTVTGTSACVSPEIFDADKGRMVAREDAKRQVWPLLGYALKEQLHRKAERTALADGLEKVAETILGRPTDYRDRVLSERERVNGDLEKLTAFLASDKVATVDAADLELLRAQAAVMTDLRDILDERIERFPGAPS